MCDSLATVKDGETWRETAAYWTFRGLEQAALRLPEAVGRRAFAAGGVVEYRRSPRLRAVVAANQARILGRDPADPRVERLAREVFGCYARYWYDTFRLPSLTRAALNARLDVRGLRHIDAALAAGKGCLTVLPHLGNWDVAGRFLAANGYRIAVVVEALRPPRLAAFFRRHRERLGMRVVALSDGPRAGREVARLLADNWIVALVADRDLTGHGVEVEMFGAPRRIPAGPARLSLLTGAPLLVCPVRTTPSGWCIDVRPLDAGGRSGDGHVDAKALACALAAAFERAIASQPSDWCLFQPAWRDAVVAVAS